MSKEENYSFSDKEGVFQTKGQMVRANPMTDGGMSLGFHTTELTDEEKVKVMSLFGKYGAIAFREADEFFDPNDVPKLDKVDEKKSPSERLRDVIFIWSKQKEVPSEKFNEFYRKKMEVLINWVKSQLEQEDS